MTLPSPLQLLCRNESASTSTAECWHVFYQANAEWEPQYVEMGLPLLLSNIAVLIAGGVTRLVKES